MRPAWDVSGVLHINFQENPFARLRYIGENVLLSSCKMPVITDLFQ
jgi:hypothetical protein